jgi:hypothetical protein
MIQGLPYQMVTQTRNMERLTITAAAGDLVLGDIPIPSGLNYAALDSAYLRLSFRKSVDTSAALNFIVANQYIQINDGTAWNNAILVPINSISTPASTTNFQGLISGDTNIKDVIKTIAAAGVTTGALQWAQADAQGNNLVLYDIHAELILTFVVPIIVD